MSNSQTTNISGSTVGAAATGTGAQAKGTVTINVGTLTQEEHRKAMSDAQAALVRDQDALDRIDSRLYEALGQFLRMARSIEVEQKSLVELQAKMKETLDDVWAQQAAEGMKPQALPKTLDVASSIATNPILVEVAKKLIGA